MYKYVKEAFSQESLRKSICKLILSFLLPSVHSHVLKAPFSYEQACIVSIISLSQIHNGYDA